MQKKSIRKIKTTCDNTKKKQKQLCVTLIAISVVSSYISIRKSSNSNFCSFIFTSSTFSILVFLCVNTLKHKDAQNNETTITIQAHSKHTYTKEMTNQRNILCSNLKSHYVYWSKQYYKFSFHWGHTMWLCSNVIHAGYYKRDEWKEGKKEWKKKLNSHSYTLEYGNRISRWLMKLIRNINRIIHI